LGAKKLIYPVKVNYIEIWAYLMGIYLVWKVGDREFRIQFQTEIEDWITYQDRKRFEKRITKLIITEMEKYHISDKEIEKLIKEAFPEPEYKIIYPETESKSVAEMLHRLAYA
jgi:hypothetical protein